MDEVVPDELKSSKPRRGKWSPEEEKYTEHLVMDFSMGILDLPAVST